MQWALKQLDDLMIEEDGYAASAALLLAGVGHGPVTQRPGRQPGTWPRRSSAAAAVASGHSWLLRPRSAQPGDWSLTNPQLEPGGWFFEYRNGFYPDIDDTAMVLMGLAQQPGKRDDADSSCRPSARPALAARHAESRRRLGGVRPRHQPRSPHQGALRRPQRHARSELSGHHRPRAGSARPPRLRRRASAGGAAPSRSCESTQDQPAAGSAAGASITSMAPGRCCWACSASAST